MAVVEGRGGWWCGSGGGGGRGGEGNREGERSHLVVMQNIMQPATHSHTIMQMC